MKERTIRICVLATVFVIAMFVASYVTNRGNTDMTADMSNATLPTISFQKAEKTVNLLVGHRQEMNPTAMRDTILPIQADEKIQVNINAYKQKIKTFSYEVFSADGTESIAKYTEKEPGKAIEISLGEIVQEKEQILRIQLGLEKKENVYYYTRIIKDTGFSFAECMKYIETLHTSMLKNQESDILKESLESNEQGDNTTLQHVTIHSDLKHARWGDLKPELVGKIHYEIQETKPAYTSVALRYQVQCKGANDRVESYDVKEFFQVSLVNGKSYLLNYDRELQEIFDAGNANVTTKGIHLGLVDEELQYKANSKGTIVAFVQNQELWSYSQDEDELALVFSFADSAKEDERHNTKKHLIKILSMEDNGNITFAVYGYMNRGVHEGESGAAIYHFNLSKNIVKEQAFVPSNQAALMIEKELGEVAYYNNKADVLYVMLSGSLQKIDMQEGTETVLLENLQEGEYVSSDDGKLLAYKKGEDGHTIEVIDFSDGSKRSVKAEQGETLTPIGFVQEDFVYGVTRDGDPFMYKLEIRNLKNKLIKTYDIPDIYITDAYVENNMITLERAVNRDGSYSKTGKDYITNNEEKANLVTLQSYWTERKETQYRLEFEEGIKNKKLKVLKPKQVLFERDTTLETQGEQEVWYCAYGLGELVGVYEKAGNAVQKAKEVSGVAVTPKQNYLWENGNRVSWYRNFEMDSFTAKAGETTLAASLRAVLAYAGQSVDATTELQSKSVEQILSEYSGGEGVKIEGCYAQDLRYLIDKGIPVIATTGSQDAIVLVGYDAETLTYIDPSSGSIRIRKAEVIDDMLEGNGNTFYAYVK